MKTKLMLAAAIAFAALATGAAAETGAELYAEHCASCHGADGKSDTAVGRALGIPALDGGDHSAEALGELVEGNDKHKALRGKLAPDDLQALAAHLATLGGG